MSHPPLRVNVHAPPIDPKRFLPRPVIRYGVYSLEGGREYQEDRATALPDVNYASVGYFALFDGHGGAYVADYLSRNFHLQLSLHPQFKYDTQSALRETWRDYDEKLFAVCQQRQSDCDLDYFPTDGSTASVVIIKHDELLVTNCGDSAVVVVGVDGHTRKVSETHCVESNERERARCLAGGAALLSTAEFEAQQALCESPTHHTSTASAVLPINDASESSGKREPHGTGRERERERGFSFSRSLSRWRRSLFACVSRSSVVNAVSLSLSHSPTDSAAPSRTASQNALTQDKEKNGEAAKLPKKRVYPGGLLVTRSFGDFYAKKEFLGGIKGGIVHDHGELLSIDMREEKVKYIILASDGVWDVITADQAMAIIEGSLTPSASSTRSDARSLRAMSSVVPEGATATPPRSPRSPRRRKMQSQNSFSAINTSPETVRQEVHDLVMKGHINTKESALDVSLSAAAKRICAAAVNSRHWTKEGMRADNASCIVIEISFPR